MSDYYLSRGNATMIFHRDHVSNLKTFIPVVVIDPEDREAVERLSDLYDGLSTDAMQAALREFANPTPPRIDEPGTWGVVEASCPHSDTRRAWVHHPDGNWWPAFDYSTVPERTPLPDGWDDLIDPTLVREGVAR